MVIDDHYDADQGDKDGMLQAEGMVAGLSSRAIIE